MHRYDDLGPSPRKRHGGMDTEGRGNADITAQRRKLEERFAHTLGSIISKYEQKGAEHSDVLDLDTEEVVEDHGDLAKMEDGSFGDYHRMSFIVSASKSTTGPASSSHASPSRREHVPLDATVRGLGRPVTDSEGVDSHRSPVPSDPTVLHRVDIGGPSQPHQGGGAQGREAGNVQEGGINWKTHTDEDGGVCDPIDGCSKAFCFQCAAKAADDTDIDNGNGSTTAAS
eukprot:m.68439 g.68439  ORF g.68439 m.68439 type:complete len:228 (-) comp8510_c0_seq1:1878-2561(-)